MRERLKTIAFAAVVSALAVAGLAIAQDDGDSEGQGKVRHADRLVGPPPGGPHPGGGRNLTYSETHLREDGEDVTVRTDQGKVTASDGDSIEIERNDGETLDIAVDDDTHVFAGPRKRDADVEDIAVGRRVIVVRRSGSEAAELVGVVPKHPLRMRLRVAPPRGDGFGPPGEMPAPPPAGGGE